MLYAACIDDYFIFNEMNLLGFCERNSVICSKARDIAGTPADFCKALGFTQNENENFEDLLEAIISNSTIKPVCFNMKPSSSLFGPASKIKDFEKFIILQIEISLLTMLSLIILFNFF